MLTFPFFSSPRKVNGKATGGCLTVVKTKTFDCLSRASHTDLIASRNVNGIFTASARDGHKKTPLCDPSPLRRFSAIAREKSLLQALLHLRSFVLEICRAVILEKRDFDPSEQRG